MSEDDIILEAKKSRYAQALWQALEELFEGFSSLSNIESDHEGGLFYLCFRKSQQRGENIKNGFDMAERLERLLDEFGIKTEIIIHDEPIDDLDEASDHYDLRENRMLNEHRRERAVGLYLDVLQDGFEEKLGRMVDKYRESASVRIPERNDKFLVDIEIAIHEATGDALLDEKGHIINAAPYEARIRAAQEKINNVAERYGIAPPEKAWAERVTRNSPEGEQLSRQ